MDKGRKIAFNRHLILFFTLFVILIGMSVSFLTDNEDRNIALSVVGFVLSAAPIFGILISPVIYIFNDEGLTIIYCLGIKEQIAWKEIRYIAKRGGWFGSGGDGMPAYEIVYPERKKYPFFVDSCVVRNRKTTKLIKKYYKKDIKGYWD